MPVVLLCHCDGTNGSTTFTDVSPSGNTLSATSATVSTTSPKFGTGSASFPNSSSWITQTAGLTSDWNFGAGQFTVEAWAYFASTPSGVQGALAQFGASNNLGWFFGTSSGSLNFYYSTTGTDNPVVGAAFSPTLNTWYHLAVDRDASNVLRVYVNGAVIASATVSATFFASTRAVVIGNDGNATRGFPGNLDEVRIVKGTAMYGGAFTPPTAPFSNFTTWSTTDKSASLTLTGSNLIATAGAGSQSVRGKDPKRTGKYYIEYTLGTINTGGSFGFATARTPLSTSALAAAFTVGASVNTNLAYDHFGVQITGLGSQSGTVGTGALLCAAIDLDRGLVWFRTSAAGTWNNNAANNPATSVGGVSLSGTGLGQGIDAYPFVLLNTSGNAVTANFGGSAFTGAVPAGFTSGWDDSVSIVTNVVASQVALEQWGSGVPDMQATIVLIEHWASVADAAPVVPSSDTRVMVLA